MNIKLDLQRIYAYNKRGPNIFPQLEGLPLHAINPPLLIF